MSTMGRTKRRRWPRIVLVAVAVWALAGGCAWRVPSGPRADLRHLLEQARAMDDSRAKNALLTTALHARVEEFQTLVERNLILREEILREANRLEEAFRQSHQLEPADLKLVSEWAGRYFQLRNELLALVDRYGCLMEYSEEELLRQGVDPRLRLVAVMVSVGAALTLHDNYLTAVLRFERSNGLRRFVNHGDQSSGLDRRQMEEIGQSARSILNRGQLRGAIASCEEWRKQYAEWKARFHPGEDGIDILDQDYAYLELLIGSSFSYEFIMKVRPGRLGGLKLETLGRTIPDALQSGGDALLRALTRVFVEAMALFESRQGMLYQPEERRAETLEHLQSILRPGDILLEKAPFRLTDRVVPGYWGHVGIWTGTRDDLMALGLWEEPALGRPQPRGKGDVRGWIESGRCVIEAVRGGVTMNTLEHFLNVDDLVVLRPRMNDAAERLSEQRDALLAALSHLGKRYDFGFNAHTRDRIVCSELVFQSYTQPEFHWPKASMMGRYTISPDQVALRAIRADHVEPPLRIVAFYHKGERRDETSAELEALMFRLLKLKEKDQSYPAPPGPGRGASAVKLE